MSVGQMSVSQMSVCQISVGQMSVGQMSVGQMFFDRETWNRLDLYWLQLVMNNKLCNEIMHWR